MRYLKKIVIVAFVFTILSGCSIVKPLEFKSINSLSIEDGSKKGVTLIANITLYNPNGVEIDINSVDIDVYAEGVNLGKLQTPETITVERRCEFTADYKVDINFMKLLLAGQSVLSKLKSGKVEVELRGKIDANFLWMNRNFNVDYNEKINIR